MLGYVQARVLRPLAENQTLLILCITTMVVMMGFGVLSPVLPLYAQSFGVSTAAIGLTITAFGAARLVVNLPAGFLSERYGRRLLLVSGPAVAAVGSLAGGLAPTFEWLVVSRFVAGAGSAIYMTGAMIFLTDITTDEDRGRMMSIYQGSLLAGVAIGPAIGGLVAELFGLAAPFYLVAVLAALTVPWALGRVPETMHIGRDSDATRADAAGGLVAAVERPGRTLALLTRPDFLLVCMLTFSIFLTRTGGRLTLVPLVGENRLGMSAGAIGVVFAMMVVLNLIVLAPAGTMIDRLGRKAAIVPSAIISAAALSLFAIAGHVWVFVLAGAVHGVGSGVLGPAPAAYAADIAPPGMRGITMGLYRTFGDAGFVVGPVALGALADLSGFGTALVINAALLVSFALPFGMYAKETLRRQPVPQPGEEPV